MTIPTLIFGVVISSLLAAAFHLLCGGNLGRLLFYLVISWVGFWTGHFIGAYFNIGPGKLGSLYLGSALIFCLIFLLIGSWLGISEKIKHRS
jgi:hypothetical protein